MILSWLFACLFAKPVCYLIIIEGRVCMLHGYKIIDPSGKATIVAAENRDDIRVRVNAA